MRRAARRPAREPRHEHGRAVGRGHRRGAAVLPRGRGLGLGRPTAPRFRRSRAYAARGRGPPMNHVLSIYIVVLSAIAMAGCVWLIRWTGKRRPGDPKPDDTSHTWDEDLTEYNKPMPRWWLVLFYLTIVFAVGYLIYYPGLGAWRGTAGWSSAGEHDAEQALAEKRLAETFAAYEGRSIEELAKNQDALRHGRSIFANHCATCHGSDARGAKGFPNLTDDIWHW